MQLRPGSAQAALRNSAAKESKRLAEDRAGDAGRNQNGHDGYIVTGGRGLRR